MSRATWKDVALGYAQAAVRAEKLYRSHMEDVTALSDAYAEAAHNRTGVGLIDAASRAKSDPRRIDAKGSAEWARQDAQMYASLAHMAATMHQIFDR